MQHTQETILAEITDIARLVFEDPSLELKLETSSEDVPKWDSLRHIALIVEAECRFDIRFRSNEIEELKIVGELVRLIQAKMELITA
jgi:acyl carrier protein